MISASETVLTVMVFAGVIFVCSTRMLRVKEWLEDGCY